MKKLAVLQTNYSEQRFAVTISVSEHLISLGYIFVGYTNFDILETKAQKMIVEFEAKQSTFKKEFDYIKMGWFPLHTTKIQREKFEKIEKETQKFFEMDLAKTEFWHKGRIKNNGYINAMINNNL